MKLELFAGSLLVLLGAGCGDHPSAANPVAEVRGEPIARAPRRAEPSRATSDSPSPSPSPSASPSAASVPAAGAAPTPAAPVASAAPSQPAAASLAGNVASAPAAAGAVKPATGPDAGNAPYPLVGFDKLAGYTIEISDELLGPVTNDLAAVTARTEALIPDAVKAFSRKHVSLRGFMLPLKVEGGLVTELLIMKDQSMCCYGTVPKIHEWVSVKMSEKGVKPVMDQPVTLFGTLHVGEMRENGYLTGIYRLDGERMAPLEE